MAAKTFVFRPTFRGIFVFALSFPVFAFFSWNVGKDVGHFPLLSLNGVGNIVLATLFGFGSLFALYALLKIKVIMIDSKGILIRYPILVRETFFAFQDIQSAGDEPFKIRVGQENFFDSYDYKYDGKNLIIHTNRGRKIEINSFQTQNFDKLYQIIRSHVGNVSKEKEQRRRQRK